MCQRKIRSGCACQSCSDFSIDLIHGGWTSRWILFCFKKVPCQTDNVSSSDQMWIAVLSWFGECHAKLDKELERHSFVKWLKAIACWGNKNCNSEFLPALTEVICQREWSLKHFVSKRVWIGRAQLQYPSEELFHVPYKYKCQKGQIKIPVFRVTRPYYTFIFWWNLDFFSGFLVDIILCILKGEFAFQNA